MEKVGRRTHRKCFKILNLSHEYDLIKVSFELHVPGWRHMSNQQGGMMKDNYQRYERCLQYYITKIIIRVSKIINYLFKFICVTRFTSKTHLCFILICLKYPILIEKTPLGAMGHHQPGLLMPAPKGFPTCPGPGRAPSPRPSDPERPQQGQAPLDAPIPLTTLLLAGVWTGGLTGLFIIHHLIFKLILTVQQMYVIIQQC